jgi:hypothetical protein
MGERNFSVNSEREAFTATNILVGDIILSHRHSKTRANECPDDNRE